LPRGWRRANGKLPASLDPRFRILPLLADQAFGEFPALAEHEIVVEQGQCLRGDSGHIPALATEAGVWHVEGFKQRHAERALEVEIDAAPGVFGYVEGHGPLTDIFEAGFLLLRQWGNDGRSAHLEVQGTGGGDDRVADDFRFEPVAIHAP